MSQCSKKCNEIKKKIDSISGLNDEIIYSYLKILENITNDVVKRINEYADKDKLNGTYWSKNNKSNRELGEMRKWRIKY